jgi:uncharacterized membrane protein
MVLTYLSGKLSGNDVYTYEKYYDMYYNLFQGSWSWHYALPQITWYAGLVTFAISIMNFMLGIGFMTYCFNVVKKTNPDFGNLFDGFAMFLKFIWLGILMFIFVFLWSLLLIIPGIVAAYRYRQAFYIMIDHPEMSALDCITASKKMMMGHKGELFVMDLSFLGWYLLCAVPFVGIWVYPYSGISFATYYVALRDIDNPQAHA